LWFSRTECLPEAKSREYSYGEAPYGHRDKINVLNGRVEPEEKNYCNIATAHNEKGVSHRSQYYFIGMGP